MQITGTFSGFMKLGWADSFIVFSLPADSVTA
jgi:hypothetical protein